MGFDRETQRQRVRIDGNIATSNLSVENSFSGIDTTISDILTEMQSRTKKLLGQLRPAAATPTSIYNPPSGATAEDIVVVICNTTAVAAKYRIFHDNTLTTYTQATALAYDVVIGGNTTEVFEVPIQMSSGDPALRGNIAVESDTTNALTFTAYGVEKT